MPPSPALLRSWKSRLHGSARGLFSSPPPLLAETSWCFRSSPLLCGSAQSRFSPEFLRFSFLPPASPYFPFKSEPRTTSQHDTENLAGEEGFEPPYPVLETGVLSVGLLP